jgi:hypothetical protein
MKKLFFMFALMTVSVAQAETIKCVSVCNLGEIKLCVQKAGADETTITAYYSTAKNENIEVNSYPYTKLHDVVLNVQNESLNAAESIQKKMANDLKNFKCSDKSSIVKTIDAPMAAQFFK